MHLTQLDFVESPIHFLQSPKSPTLQHSTHHSSVTSAQSVFNTTTLIHTILTTNSTRKLSQNPRVECLCNTLFYFYSGNIYFSLLLLLDFLNEWMNQLTRLVEVEVNLWPMVSQSVLVSDSHLEPMIRFFVFCFTIAGLLLCGTFPN
jgi:hypothetical protein